MIIMNNEPEFFLGNSGLLPGQYHIVRSDKPPTALEGAGVIMVAPAGRAVETRIYVYTPHCARMS